jgi:hypothetical protein
MITEPTLYYLSRQKIKDADVLLRHGRNNASIYLMGYALEFCLKRKISQAFGFAQGFPENRADFSIYSGQISRFNALSTGIRLSSIRHHRLDDLLTYSGLRPRITAQFYTEWLTVMTWNPEDRYIRTRITRKRAQAFIRAAKIILREIY